MKTLLVTALLVMLIIPAIGQTIEFPAPNASFASMAVASGNTLPASGVFRVLLIFTDFPGDTLVPTDSRWPVGRGPSFLNTIIDSTVQQQSGIRDNITTYFRDMSNGRLEVIGTTRYVRALKPLANYASSTKLDGTPEPEDQSNDVHKYVLRDILTHLDRTFDFAPFDNYTVSGEPGADGTVDLIILCYRHPYNPDIIKELYNGGKVYQVKDPVVLDQGARQVAGSHIVIADGRLFPDRFYVYPRAMAPLLYRYVQNQLACGIWSIMRGFEAASFMMNSIERTQLEWCRMIDVTTDTTIALTDYLRSDVAASIRVERGAGLSYYYLEYHRKERSPYIDSTATGSDATYDLADGSAGARPGLYILKGPGALEVVAADGAWDWTTSEGVLAPWSTTQRIPVFERVAVNRNRGYTDRMRLPFFNPQTGLQTEQPIYAWRDRNFKKLSNSRTSLYAGDGHDAWRVDENNIFSPWSNPSTDWLLPDNLRGKEFAVQVLEERGDTLIVRITFNDALSLPPSRPQDLHIDNELPDPTVTKLRWALNVEPDVLDSLAPERSPGMYELWRRVESITGGIIEEWHLIANMNAGEGRYDDHDFASAFACSGDTCPIPPIVRYRIRVRDSDGLWSTFSATLDIVPDAAQIELARAGTRCFVFPNPVTDNSQIFYTVAVAGHVRITIVDPTGARQRVVMDGYREAGSYVTAIAMASLPAGAFFAFVEMPDLRQSISILHTP